MKPNAEPLDPAEMAERFFTVIKSLDNFDRLELRGIVQSLIAPTQREICVLANYYRAVANIDSLLSLKKVSDVQAIAMVARALFEIAVDIRLIAKIPNSVEKIILSIEVEKLRSARKIVEFKTANPDAALYDAPYREFIAANASQIEMDANALWPEQKGNITHWSAMRLEKRVANLGSPFEQIYTVNYPQLSWYGHSGLVGVLNLEKETFRSMGGIAFSIAVESQMIILATTMKETKIDKAKDKVEQMLTYAKMVPFTDGAIQQEQLRSALLD